MHGPARRSFDSADTCPLLHRLVDEAVRLFSNAVEELGVVAEEHFDALAGTASTLGRVHTGGMLRGAVGQITPRSPGPQSPQHAVDHLAVITPRTATPIHLRQQGLYPLPRRIRQLASTCHKINYHGGLP